jgi:antitoxin MazE
MKTKLVSIGNSKGVRIPKTAIEECNMENDVELIVDSNRIIITPLKRAHRRGWDKAFQLMHERKEDSLLLEESVDMDMEDWEWK